MHRPHGQVDKAIGAAHNGVAAMVSHVVGKGLVGYHLHWLGVHWRTALPARDQLAPQDGTGRERERKPTRNRRGQDVVLHQHHPRVAHAVVSHCRAAGGAHRPQTDYGHRAHHLPHGHAPRSHKDKQAHQPCHRLQEDGRGQTCTQEAEDQRHSIRPRPCRRLHRPLRPKRHFVQHIAARPSRMGHDGRGEDGDVHQQSRVQCLQIHQAQGPRHTERDRDRQRRGVQGQGRRHRHSARGSRGNLQKFLPHRTRQGAEPRRRHRSGIR